MTPRHVDASVANKKSSLAQGPPTHHSYEQRAAMEIPLPSNKAPILTGALTRRVTSARPTSSGTRLSKIGTRVSSIGGLFSNKEAKRHSSVITESDRERIGLPSRDTVTPLPTSSGAVSYNTDVMISQFPTPPNHQGKEVGFPAFAGTDPSSTASSPPASGGATQKVTISSRCQSNALLIFLQDLGISVEHLSQQGFEHLDLLIATQPIIRAQLERVKTAFQQQQTANIKEISERIGTSTILSSDSSNLETELKQKDEEIAKLESKYTKERLVNREYANEMHHLDDLLRQKTIENDELKGKLAELEAFRDGYNACDTQMVELLAKLKVFAGEAAEEENS